MSDTFDEKESVVVIIEKKPCNHCEHYWDGEDCCRCGLEEEYEFESYRYA